MQDQDFKDISIYVVCDMPHHQLPHLHLGKDNWFDK